MFDPHGPHVFTLPPGVSFAAELVAGLQDRLAGQPPEAMARVQLFLNSQLMRRRVTEVFTTAGPGFLPRMTVVTELANHPILADLPAASDRLRRKLLLARLITPLLDAQPDLAPRSALFDLADSLAELMDEMEDEAVAPDRLAALDVSTHSAHWARTQAFLSAVTPLLRDYSSQQARFRLAVERLSAEWLINPPDGPVLVAGSTGSRGPTALLMRAVARLAQGAVVLPGFDGDLPPAVWSGLDDAMTGEDHPQFRFRKLMATLDLPLAALQPWRNTQPAAPHRNRLISLSLRPAPVTDQWLIDGATLPDLIASTADLTLINAQSPRDEAVAIALILRDAVARNVRATLITPDRDLTRRVKAALDRWGIVPDLSAGRPLALSAPGRLLRHVSLAFRQTMTADALLTLLKHPLTQSGDARGRHLRLTRELELDLRAKGPVFPTGAALRDWGAGRGDPEAAIWANAIAALLDTIAGQAPDDLTGHVARHLTVSQALARGPGQAGDGDLWQGPAGIAALSLMQLLAREAPAGGPMSAARYGDLFEGVIRRGDEVREPFTGHPLVAFHGHREAREIDADLVILGGLVDGVWPAQGKPDPWLNRRMRQDAGLLLPERQIGLAAHDYQQAMAARQVVMTRAMRNAEAETVPSRWLNRLMNLMDGLPGQNGPAALTAMKARGSVWLDLARSLDAPTPQHLADPRLKPALRPQPRPPVSARPHRLSLTRISTLIRDPYAIYARYILNLRPLDPLRATPDARDRGIAVHSILERFVKERPADEPNTAARARLLAIATAYMAATVPFPTARILWGARLARAADHFLRQDGKHGGTPVLVEDNGSVRLPDTHFVLFGRPDRIDRLPDGLLHLIDYKTGSPPTAAQQKAYDLQLHLAAAMAERGGFADLGKALAGRVSYIGLGSGDAVVDLAVTTAELDLLWDRFTRLIASYATRAVGYTARRAVFETRTPGDYDHLARFGEWQMSDRAAGFDVGPAE